MAISFHAYRPLIKTHFHSVFHGALIGRCREIKAGKVNRLNQIVNASWNRIGIVINFVE